MVYCGAVKFIVELKDVCAVMHRYVRDLGHVSLFANNSCFELQSALQQVSPNITDL